MIIHKACRTKVAWRWRLLLLIALTSGTAAPASSQGMFGPGKFVIEKSDDRFSTSTTSNISGRNNRLTKRSIVGGMYLDSHGLYLDPTAERQKDTGKIVRVGFVLHNDVQQDSRGGDLNRLGTPTAVSFLIDGKKLIKATVSDPDERSSGATTYTRLLGTASVEMSETALLTITPEEMAELASAHELATHIEGRIRGWTCEAKDVSKTFQPNLVTFYQQVIAPAGGA